MHIKPIDVCLERLIETDYSKFNVWREVRLEKALPKPFDSSIYLFIRKRY